jgi:hypothetical protein
MLLGDVLELRASPPCLDDLSDDVFSQPVNHPPGRGRWLRPDARLWILNDFLVIFTDPLSSASQQVSEVQLVGVSPRKAHNQATLVGPTQALATFTV